LNTSRDSPRASETQERQIGDLASPCAKSPSCGAGSPGGPPRPIPGEPRHPSSRNVLDAGHPPYHRIKPLNQREPKHSKIAGWPAGTKARERQRRWPRCSGSPPTGGRTLSKNTLAASPPPPPPPDSRCGFRNRVFNVSVGRTPVPANTGFVMPEGPRNPGGCFSAFGPWNPRRRSPCPPASGSTSPTGRPSASPCDSGFFLVVCKIPVIISVFCPPSSSLSLGRPPLRLPRVGGTGVFRRGSARPAARFFGPWGGKRPRPSSSGGLWGRGSFRSKAAGVGAGCWGVAAIDVVASEGRAAPRGGATVDGRFVLGSNRPGADQIPEPSARVAPRAPGRQRGSCCPPPRVFLFEPPGCFSAATPVRIGGGASGPPRRLSRHGRSKSP